jgi:hypothetical protein
MSKFLIVVSYEIEAEDITDAEVEANGLGLVDINSVPYGATFVDFEIIPN